MLRPTMASKAQPALTPKVMDLGVKAAKGRRSQ